MELSARPYIVIVVDEMADLMMVAGRVTRCGLDDVGAVEQRYTAALDKGRDRVVS
ncbi:hypothetical protein MKL09_06800 [Methylobacterium sp. J-048]|nr:hypothetical protein [Methylobacterium sp. J-048]